MAMQMFIQIGLSKTGYDSYLSSPLLLVFNWLPIFLTMLFMFFATNRVWGGYVPTAALLLLGVAIDQYKIYFLDEPFRPIDIILTSEAFNITQNYDFEINKKLVCMIAVFAVVSIILCRYVKSDKLKIKNRIIGAAVMCVLFGVSYKFIYSNGDLYDNVYVSENTYQDTIIEKEKGFLYSFLVNTKSFVYDKPKGYSEKKVDEILSEYKTETEQKTPNVIAIMSEAFFDPQAADNIRFYENPLKRYNKLKKDAYYGSIIVPGFAGSTVSTEFEFLTGINISLVDDSMPLMYKTHVKNNTYGLPEYFKNKGYTTEAIHLGHKWFYNRNNVYKRFGFDSFTALEDLEETPDMIHYYASDKETTEYIKNAYNNYLESGNDNGYFNFTVTIQNHGPYDDSTPERDRILIRPDGISDELYNVLDNYMAGLRDAAGLLCDLKEYIDDIDVPTVIVFFGDHLPYFDADFNCYRAIGYDVESDTLETMIRKYSTPYVMCSNQEAKNLVVENGGEVLNGNGGILSSNFLATKLFDYMGVKPGGFFGFVKDMREQAGVIVPTFMMDGDFIIPKDDGNVSEWIEKYRMLQYHNIKINE